MDGATETIISSFPSPFIIITDIIIIIIDLWTAIDDFISSDMIHYADIYKVFLLKIGPRIGGPVNSNASGWMNLPTSINIVFKY